MPARRREPLARDLPAELQVASTNGSILTDSRGRKYIDFVMGWCVGNFGWRPAAIAKAIERFKGPDYVYPGYAYAPWTELARLLASLAPRPLTTCFRATGGSEAVDLALQAAMIHTGRRALLSLEDSYHGNSLAGLSIGAIAFQACAFNHSACMVRKLDPRQAARSYSCNSPRDGRDA